MYANALVSLVPVCSRKRERRERGCRGGEGQREINSGVADYTRVRTEIRDNDEIN